MFYKSVTFSKKVFLCHTLTMWNGPTSMRSSDETSLKSLEINAEPSAIYAGENLSEGMMNPGLINALLSDIC